MACGRQIRCGHADGAIPSYAQIDALDAAEIQLVFVGPIAVGESSCFWFLHAHFPAFFTIIAQRTAFCKHFFQKPLTILIFLFIIVR